MKKSTGVIMIIVIVLLLGVIGVGGYFLIKGNNDSNKQIGELKNEVANLANNTENTSNNQVTNDIKLNNTTTTSSNNTQSNTSKMTESEALEIAKTTYERVYDAVNGFGDNAIFVSGNYTVNGEKIFYKAKTDMLKKYFSTDAINQLFTLYNGEYYSKRQGADPLPGIFGCTDQGIRTLTIVNYTDTKISATGQLTNGQYENDKTPLKIEFVKEGNDWVINYFE